MSKTMVRLGVAAFVLLLTLIVSLPIRGHAQLAGSIKVEDQTVIDGMLVIKRATIAQDGWIIVRKSGPDGKMLITSTVGKVQISGGDSENIVVPLSELVDEGATLWPTLHIDVGDVGVYEFPGGPDAPVMAAGAPVLARITITGTESSAPVQLSPPNLLPITAGEELPLGLLGVALALLAVGGVFVTRGEALA